jgi:transposase
MERHYVGIDFHRRRSVVVCKNEAGQVVSKVRIANSPAELAAAVAPAGSAPEVILEATYGWYWAVDLLQALDCKVHLASPSQLNWGQRRVKNDERDATDLIDLLRIGRLPEAWIAPPETRELRELVRYRAKLVALRTGLKAQIHAVLAKEGIIPQLKELWGPGGARELNSLELADAYHIRLDSLRELVGRYDHEVKLMERSIHARLADHHGYQTIQALDGVGRTIAAIFVAEIGDVTRFPTPQHLSSWAGLTPKHHESDEKVRRGGVTKQGSRLVRWAAIEAISKIRGGPKLQVDYHRIAERRGKNKARVAVARKLLTLVYYGLRDGEIRCLRQAATA